MDYITKNDFVKTNWKFKFSQKFEGQLYELVARYGISFFKNADKYVLIVGTTITSSFPRIWCTELVLSAGLYFFKKHDGCHIWRRIFLPIWNTYDPVFKWVCVAQSFFFVMFIRFCYQLVFFCSFVFGMVFSIYFRLVTLNIPFVSFASLCLPVLCHKNRN